MKHVREWCYVNIVKFMVVENDECTIKMYSKLTSQLQNYKKLASAKLAFF